MTRSFDRILTATFHEGPIFRMGYDAHVRDWRAAIQSESLIAFHRNSDFRAAYYARGGTYLKDQTNA